MEKVLPSAPQLDPKPVSDFEVVAPASVGAAIGSFVALTPAIGLAATLAVSVVSALVVGAFGLIARKNAIRHKA
jgi:hypothetical protein